MSYVATVVIFTDYVIPETEKALTAGTQLSDGGWLAFANLTRYELWDNWPGPKGPESKVFGATGNYLNPEEMIEWLRTLRWYRAAVVVWEANGDYPEPGVLRLPGEVE